MRLFRFRPTTDRTRPLTLIGSVESRPAASAAGPVSSLAAVIGGLVLALGVFATGSVSSDDSVLSFASPETAAACTGFNSGNFDAYVEPANASNTDYSAPDRDTRPYSNSTYVRVRVIVASASDWCSTYKYNAFGKSSSSVYWEYMGSGSNPSTCDYIPNSRTSQRGYLFRGTATNCATNTWAMHYVGPAGYWSEGWNAGWVKLVSCSTYAAPSGLYGNYSSPHGSCGQTVSSFQPTNMKVGGNTARAWFLDTVDPTAPTWTVSGSNAIKSGNTVYYRRNGVPFTITTAHTEIASSTKSGGKDFKRGALVNTTGWSGEYAAADHANSTISMTPWSTTANSTTRTIQSYDMADNLGSSTTITFTADATVPTVTATVGGTASTNAASPEFSNSTTNTVAWSASDSGGAGLDTSNYTLISDEGSIVTPGSCVGALWSGESGLSYSTTSTSIGTTAGYCHRFKVEASDNVGNVGSSAWVYLLVDNTGPDAPAVTDNTASLNNAHRDGSVVWFNPDNAGSVTLTAESADAESDVQSSTFETQYTLDPVTGNPADHSAAWSAGAPETALLVYSTNKASVSGDSTLMTLSPDVTAPSLSIINPVPATYAIQSETSYLLEWTGSDSESGIKNYTVARERGLTISGTDCDGVTYSPTGTVTTVTGQTHTAGSLANGYCYRWVITATDNVGNTDAETTGSILINTTSPTASVEYEHANAATESPFVHGELTVTITFSEIIDGTPLLTIERNGSSVVTDDALIATGDELVWTYAYEITADGSYDLLIDAQDLAGNPVDPLIDSFTVARLTQAITFAAIPGKTYGDASFSTGATASSGLTITYNSSGDCGVNASGTVTITGAGDCTITAIQAGNGTYQAAPNVVRTFAIAKATPVITWADPAQIMYGTVLSGTQLNATANTAGTFTYDPEAGTLLEAGTHTLLVSFVPTNTDNYNNDGVSDAEIEVLLAAPPVESGLRNWTFVDEVPRFDNGVVVVDDPTAPSGDGKVALLSSASGQQTAVSERVTVIGGENVSVWGDWRLIGHGTRLRLCYDVGGCTASATVGNLNGTTTYSIDWITFELSSVVPAGATEAWISWTVGSDSYSDGFSWSVLADDATGVTRVEVTPAITVSAPATIAFGVGLPGDALDHDDFIVNVATNNATGYDLEVDGTNLTNAGTDTINITQMQIGTANGSLTAFAGENTALPLVSASERTDATGDDHALDARLTLPFVGSGLYEGTLTFTATTN